MSADWASGAMDHEKQSGPGRNPPAPGSEEELAQNASVDDFFRRLKQDLHHPKPGNEAIAAALQAVQRLTSQVDADASASAAAESVETRTCLSCGSQNPVENRFCAICGVPQQDAPPLEPEAPAAASLKPATHAAGPGTGLVIMHSVGLPKQRHTEVQYPNILGNLETFFDQRITLAVAAGVARESIVLDPGIDFAKQKSDNLRIYRQLKHLTRFERPILLPVSRKTVIGEVLGIPDPADRDPGTIACVIAGALRGASIFRVHNVHAVVQALRVIHPIIREFEAGA